MTTLRTIALAVLICVPSVSARVKMLMEKSDETPVIAPVEGKALLVMMRITSYGFAMITDNYIDGKWIGQTKKKCYYLTEIEPGDHYLQCAYDEDDISSEKITFEAGKIYFFSQALFPTGPWSAGMAIAPKTDVEAREQLPECQYLVVGDDPGEDLEAEDYKEALEEFEEQVKEDPDSKKNTAEYKGYTSFTR